MSANEKAVKNWANNLTGQTVRPLYVKPDAWQLIGYFTRAGATPTINIALPGSDHFIPFVGEVETQQTNGVLGMWQVAAKLPSDTPYALFAFQPAARAQQHYTLAVAETGDSTSGSKRLFDGRHTTQKFIAIGSVSVLLNFKPSEVHELLALIEIKDLLATAQLFLALMDHSNQNLPSARAELNRFENKDPSELAQNYPMINADNHQALVEGVSWILKRMQGAGR